MSYLTSTMTAPDLLISSYDSIAIKFSATTEESQHPTLNVKIVPQFINSSEPSFFKVYIDIENPNLRAGKPLVTLKLREGTVCFKNFLILNYMLHEDAKINTGTNVPL